MNYAQQEQRDLDRYKYQKGQRALKTAGAAPRRQVFPKKAIKGIPAGTALGMYAKQIIASRADSASPDGILPMKRVNPNVYRNTGITGKRKPGPFPRKRIGGSIPSNW